MRINTQDYRENAHACGCFLFPVSCLILIPLRVKLLRFGSKAAENMSMILFSHRDESGAAYFLSLCSTTPSSWF